MVRYKNTVSFFSKVIKYLCQLDEIKLMSEIYGHSKIAGFSD